MVNLYIKLKFFLLPIEVEIDPTDYVHPGNDPTLLKLVKGLFLKKDSSDLEVKQTFEIIIRMITNRGTRAGNKGSTPNFIKPYVKTERAKSGRASLEKGDIT